MINRRLNQQAPRSDASNHQNHSNNLTHYEILNISRTASHEDIRAAYLLQLKLYLDQQPHQLTVERYKSIWEAYEILKGDNTRRIYDSQLAEAEIIRSPANRPRFYTASFTTLFKPGNQHEQQLRRHFINLSVSFAVEVTGSALLYKDPESTTGALLSVIGLIGMTLSRFKILQLTSDNNARFNINVDRSNAPFRPR